MFTKNGEEPHITSNNDITLTDIAGTQGYEKAI